MKNPHNIYAVTFPLLNNAYLLIHCLSFRCNSLLSTCQIMHRIDRPRWNYESIAWELALLRFSLISLVPLVAKRSFIWQVRQRRDNMEVIGSRPIAEKEIESRFNGRSRPSCSPPFIGHGLLFRGNYGDTLAAYWQPRASRITGVIVVAIPRRGLLMAVG